MTATTPLDTRVLYDRDYFLWLTSTAEQLKQGRFSELDLENLVEEIDSMGKSQKNAIKNLLIILLVHLLKLAYWETERERTGNHWRIEIMAFRDQLHDLLSSSPSLKSYVSEIFQEAYRKAIRRVAGEMKVKRQNFPEFSPINLEKTLDDDWFPISFDSDE
jgi:hypothetical protein